MQPPIIGHQQRHANASEGSAKEDRQGRDGDEHYIEFVKANIC